jgi:polygalacturonase
METNSYNPATSLRAYYTSRSKRQIARHLGAEATLHDLGQIGILKFFEGSGSDPTALAGYASNKIWLRQYSNVQDTAGDFLVWNGVGPTSNAANWVPATPSTVLPKMFINVLNYGTPNDGNSNAATGIQEALSFAAVAGGGTVYVPAGTYRLDATLRMGSRTKLLCDPGVRFTKNHPNTFLNNGLGYDAASNIPEYEGNGDIEIDGGTWAGFDLGVFDGYTGFALGYGRNIVVRNATLLDSIGGGHAIDLSACDGVLFENCRFLGYALNGGDPSIADCIQLDHNTETLSGVRSFPYFGLPKRKLNRNVSVRRCEFGPNPGNNDIRFGSHKIAVGSHGSVHGEWAENITIADCTMNAVEFTVLRVWKWRNVTIENNRFTNCFRPIHVTATAAGGESSRDAAGVQQNQADGSVEGLYISGNTARGTTDRFAYFGFYTYGTDTSGRHRNVRLCNNEILDGTSVSAHQIDGQQFDGLDIESGLIDGCYGAILMDGVTNPSYNIRIGAITVRNATVAAGSTGAIYIAGGSRAIIDGAIVDTVVGRGIYITQSTDGSCNPRRIENCGGAGVWVQSSSNGWSIDVGRISNTNTASDASNGQITVTTSSVGCSVNVGWSDFSVAPVQVQAPGGRVSFPFNATPESAVEAPIGATCNRVVGGGAGSTFYVKESGTSTAGWVGK